MLEQGAGETFIWLSLEQLETSASCYRGRQEVGRFTGGRETGRDEEEATPFRGGKGDGEHEEYTRGVEKGRKIKRLVPDAVQNSKEREKGVRWKGVEA